MWSAPQNQLNSFGNTLSLHWGWESAHILKSIITNFQSIDNRLKSAEVIKQIKSINTGNTSHLMISKASYHFHQKYVFWNN